MLLIADSGSTKTEWRLVDNAGSTVATVITEGLNPYFLTQQQITSTVEAHILPAVNDVDKVFFYGAGCGLPVKAEKLREVLDLTVNAKYPAEVAGDILGSARSLLQNDEGIACILGTGANSCLYNGRDITEVMPSLGYMFSDWGSGTVMSKDLIAMVLQEKLPSFIIQDFHDTYRLGRAQILDSIYNLPMPNRFLASFSPFLLKHSAVPEMKELIIDNFSKFFAYYVSRLAHNKDEIRVSFTGSIAYHFKPYLHEVAESMGIVIAKIVQHPMDGLIKFHCTTMPVVNRV
jgi:glucosamine kinase